MVGVNAAAVAQLHRPRSMDARGVVSWEEAEQTLRVEARLLRAIEEEEDSKGRKTTSRQHRPTATVPFLLDSADAVPTAFWEGRRIAEREES